MRPGGPGLQSQMIWISEQTGAVPEHSRCKGAYEGQENKKKTQAAILPAHVLLV